MQALKLDVLSHHLMGFILIGLSYEINLMRYTIMWLALWELRSVVNDRAQDTTIVVDGYILTQYIYLVNLYIRTVNVNAEMSGPSMAERCIPCQLSLCYP